MPRQVSRADAVAEAVRVIRAHPERTAWIGIDGRGGAGKSSLAALIVAALPSVHVVHVDDFWGPAIPEWDWLRFVAQVRDPLLGGASAEYQEWDWNADAGGPWHRIPAAAPVVVEGVSATRDEVGLAWDLTVWVETPRDLRLQRALDRDGPDLMHRWLEDWMPSEERYIAAQRPDERADLLVLGTE